MKDMQTFSPYKSASYLDFRSCADWRNHQEPTLVTILSERDRKRKTGGTRDTIALWPFQKNHVTINPDVFLAAVPEPTPDVAQPSKPLSNRPVLYVVCTDLSSDPKANAALLAEMEGSTLPPLALDLRKDHLIAGFKTIFSAMEFCEIVSRTMVRSFQQKNFLRISLHAGPVHIDSEEVRQNLAGDVIEMVERLHKLTLPGSMYATGIIAAILALDISQVFF